MKEIATYTPAYDSETSGFCAWFTGLSGSGKTATAEKLQTAIEARGRRVTLLDGDVVREHLSKGLGFTREDRDTNVLRIGYVASRIAYHGGVALCSLIGPYRDTRDRVRELFAENNFLEIYLATPLDVCEARDPKGHYQKVREGSLRSFTGIDDPYEPPIAAEITLDTSNATVNQNVQIIMNEIISRGFME